MRPGTLVELPDGRRGRVVYNFLDGYGIRWGEEPVDVEAILTWTTTIEPQAMLRAPYPSADIECVGEDYTIIED